MQRKTLTEKDTFPRFAYTTPAVAVRHECRSPQNADAAKGSSALRPGKMCSDRTIVFRPAPLLVATVAHPNSGRPLAPTTGQPQIPRSVDVFRPQ